MRKKIMLIPILLFILYILVCPKDAVNSASFGLMLWYQKVLPSLLPFAILSNILIDSGYLPYFTKYLYPATKLLLPTSEAGSYVVLSGFLFGFPMGAKNSARLCQNHLISKAEAEILTIVCNNISPVFICGYIMSQQLHLPGFCLYAILLVYAPPLLLGAILLRKNKSNIESKKIPASRPQMNFKIIDTGIMNGFETLTKLGGYIMLFSILSSALLKIPLSIKLQCILIGITEITNGIAHIPVSESANCLQILFALGITAWGGLSGLAQTCSVTKECHFSIKRYVRYRILFACLTMAMTYLFFFFTNTR